MIRTPVCAAAMSLGAGEDRQHGALESFGYDQTDREDCRPRQEGTSPDEALPGICLSAMLGSW